MISEIPAASRKSSVADVTSKVGVAGRLFLELDPYIPNFQFTPGGRRYLEGSALNLRSYIRAQAFTHAAKDSTLNHALSLICLVILCDSLKTSF